jgi:alkanesulfonate monooxygenase SsuD/methylene tetrahydromethanopterin reductase-like flavin-dependent oxidoreductase (luciferase family)
MREFIALLRECLSGAKVTFAGDYYQVRGFRLGVELDGCRSPPRPAAVLLPKTSSMLVPT